MEALGTSALIQLMLAMTLIAVAFLLYMAQESQISVQQINLSILRSQHMQLVADNTSLGITASGLQSTPRVDRLATSRLGMSTTDTNPPMYVSVTAPALAPIRPVNADTVEAQRASSPLAWMSRFLDSLHSSL